MATSYNIHNGVGKVYYAVMTTEDTKAQAPVYSEVKELGELIEFNISSEESSVPMYAGDRKILEFDDPYKGSATITIPALTPEAKADLLGYRKVKNGYIKDATQKKYVAIMLEQHAVNSQTKAIVNDFITLFKCTVAESEYAGKTKEESQEFQTTQISLNAVTPSTEGYTDFKYIVSDSDPDFDDAFLTKWGSEVPTIEEVTP